MTLEITGNEQQYLAELLESAYEELLHELHHTDTADFKEILLEKVALVEGLLKKIKGA